MQTAKLFLISGLFALLSACEPPEKAVLEEIVDCRLDSLEVLSSHRRGLAEFLSMHFDFVVKDDSNSAELFKENAHGYSKFTPVFIYFDRVAAEVEICLESAEQKQDNDLYNSLLEYLQRIQKSSTHLRFVIEENGELRRYDIDHVVSYIEGSTETL